MARKKNTKKRRSGLLGALVLLILLGVMAYKLVEVYGVPRRRPGLHSGAGP